MLKTQEQTVKQFRANAEILSFSSTTGTESPSSEEPFLMYGIQQLTEKLRCSLKMKLKVYVNNSYTLDIPHPN